MSRPSPEARAKIAESLRRYYANPAAQAKLRQAASKGGRATTSRRAEAEAEVAELRAEAERLRAELTRLSGGDPR